jgi:hypothetical protein
VSGEVIVSAASDGALLAPTPRGGEDRLRRQTERLGFLAHLARTVGGSMQTERAVTLALQLIVPGLVDWGQVVLREGGRLRCQGTLAGGPVRHATTPAPRDSGHPLNRVLARGAREVTMVDGGTGPGSQALASLVPADGLREDLLSIRPADLLVIPLTARGRGFGALALARQGGEGFDEDAVEFLDEVAHSLAVTLDATRALADSRRVAGVLGRDLAPPSLPAMPGARLAKYYRVAFEHEALGGDFYDVHGEPDDWTAVVGDVCGKGVEAAVLTGRVRQAVRTAALVDRSPTSVLDVVNRVLVRDGEGTFVTALCARVHPDGEDLVMDVAAAGHHPPLVLRGDAPPEPVPVEGTVLGLFEPLEFAATRIVLRPGDSCVFYTDGVLEAPGSTGQFGEQRLREVLAAAPREHVSTVIETVAMSLGEHIGDRPHDDIAILGIQNNPDRTAPSPAGPGRSA